MKLEMNKELNFSEIRAVQLEILKYFTEFCTKNSLKYSLSFGTLLGAIRHKGFIPWDDDIDIMMPRPDYNKFLKLFNQKKGKFRVLSLHEDSNYPYTYAKVEDTSTVLIEEIDLKYNIGINIDIFPIDGVPSKMKDFNRYFRKVKFFRNLLGIKITKIVSSRSFLKNSILKILKVIFSPITYQYFVRIIDNELEKYDYDSSEFLMSPCIHLKYEHRANRKLYENTILVEFEGERYSAIEEYDNYLTMIYGEYLKLPPASKRVTHHSFKGYIK